MQVAKNIFISLVMAGPSKDSVFEQWELDSESAPRFGRNWWFWKPALKSNGGKFKADENTDVGVMWLCFSLSLTVFSWAKTQKPTNGNN